MKASKNKELAYVRRLSMILPHTSRGLLPGVVFMTFVLLCVSKPVCYGQERPDTVHETAQSQSEHFFWPVSMWTGLSNLSFMAQAGLFMVQRDFAFPMEALLLATALKNAFDRTFDNFSLFYDVNETFEITYLNNKGLEGLRGYYSKYLMPFLNIGFDVSLGRYRGDRLLPSEDLGIYSFHLLLDVNEGDNYVLTVGVGQIIFSGLTEQDGVDATLCLKIHQGKRLGFIFHYGFTTIDDTHLHSLEVKMLIKAGECELVGGYRKQETPGLKIDSPVWGVRWHF